MGQAERLAKALDEKTWTETHANLRKDNGGLSTWLTELLGEQPEAEISDLVCHESYANVSTAISAYITNLQQRSANVGRVSGVTINGTKKGNAIPQFVQSLIYAIGTLQCHSLSDRRLEIGGEDAERLLSLSIDRSGRDRYQRLQRTVADLLGVELEVFKGKTSAELDLDKYLANMNGSGIREALRLILDVELKQPKVLLVEEPELHLHPSLQTTMMRYLADISSECQVFLTTHSTHFLDPGEMNNVYLVSQSKATGVQRLDREAAETVLPGELGLRLSSLFMYDRLVFVEGVSDEAVLREWANKLGLHLGRANVGFVLMNGSRNMSYFAAEVTLNHLAKRQVELHFVIDRDERSSPEVDEIVRKLGNQTQTCVLNRRELENYLVCARAIAEFIRKKRLSSGEAELEPPAEADVTTAIDEAAESLKELAVSKRLSRQMKPIYFRQDKSDGDDAVSRLTVGIDKQIEELQIRKTGIAASYEAARSAVEASWDSEKLSIVPGDELLDTVCRRFGVRFKKESDSLNLASLMTDGEIDSEIKELLQHIAATNRK